MRFMRRLLHGEAAYLTDVVVRERVQCPTITSLIRVRRIRWLQSLLRRPDHHPPLLAVLFGNIRSHPVHQLTSMGIPTTNASPWVQQWWLDLSAMAPFSAPVALAIRKHGFLALHWSPEFLTFDSS
eukprot:4656262-Heterocapsa_arctica.AAC.1